MRTIKFDSTSYAAEFKKRHHSYEIFAFGKFKFALDEQVKAVVHHVKVYGGITPAISDMLITRKPIEQAYRTVYVKVGTLHAFWTMRKVNAMGRAVKDKPGFFSELWNRLMEKFFNDESASRVSDVTETTRERVRTVLADSLDLPLSQRATYIEEMLNDPDFNRTRSLMIARTESTTAANYGASLGNEEADYETVKQWIAIEDSNTRPSHRDADGQQVANTDMFVVGSSEAMYPGDMSLPAGEVVNCRCCVAYVPLLSESGLPILKTA